MKILGPYALFIYADIILLEEFWYNVEDKSINTIQSTYNIGLVINKNKTKYMLMNRIVKSTICVTLFTFEQVGDFKYLELT